MRTKNLLSPAAHRRGHALCTLAFLIGLVALLPGAKCPAIPEMEDVEVTIVADDVIELVFEARGDINTHSSEEMIDVADLREDLLDAGFDLTMIDSAWVTDVLYGVVAYNEEVTDREIQNGTVTVTWEQGMLSDSQALFDDVDVEVYPLLGVLAPAPFEPGAIEFLNDLLADVLDDLRAPDLATEFLVYADSEGDSEPQGRDTDFDWRIRIHFQIVGRVVVEVPKI